MKKDIMEDNMRFYYSEGNTLVYAQQISETEYVLSKYSPEVVAMAYAESIVKKDPFLFVKLLEQNTTIDTITTNNKDFLKRLKNKDYIEDVDEIDVVFRNNLFLLTCEKCSQCVNDKTCTQIRPICNAAGMCKMFLNTADVCSPRHINILKNYVAEISKQSKTIKELTKKLINAGFKTKDMAMMGHHHVVAVENQNETESSFAFFNVNEYEIESYMYMLDQINACTTMLESKGATDIHVNHLPNKDISITYFANNDMHEIKIIRMIILLTNF